MSGGKVLAVAAGIVASLELVVFRSMIVWVRAGYVLGDGDAMLKFRSLVSAAAVQTRDLFSPPLASDPLPRANPKKARGVVVSFYMPNISRMVVAAQRRLLKRFTPADVDIAQIMTLRSHEDALNQFMDTTPYRAVLVLDIDCVPIREGSVASVFDRMEQGRLVGAAQRAAHIENGGHVYAGPFCLGISQSAYQALGRPRFDSTSRGDVGEELTFAAEQSGVPVDLMWPIASDDDIWPLTRDHRYGHGTTYDGGFWHAFQIRFTQHQRDFADRCGTFLAAR